MDIIIKKDNTVVGGTNDDDYISNTKNNVTIVGSRGDDEIDLNGSKQVIDYSKIGYKNNGDTISGFEDDDTIVVNDSAFDLSNKIDVDGNNVELGYRFITINDAVDKKINIVANGELGRFYVPSTVVANQNINVADGIDYVVNHSKGSTVNANGANVFNYADTVLVKGSDGADSIYNAGTQATLDGGAGNDSIYSDNNGFENSINAGDGNDTIQSSYNIIAGGAGNDLINGSSNLVQYADGDGNDTIRGFGIDSTLQVTEGAISSSTTDGLDAMINVGSGSIRLKNMAGRQFNLADAAGDTVSTVVGDILYTSAKGDTVENSANGKIIKIQGDENTDTVVTLKGARQIIDVANNNANITLYGYDADDTVRIVEESWTKAEIDGNDIRFSAGDNAGSLTFKNVGNKKITILSEDGQTLYVMPGVTTIPKDSDITRVENNIDNATINALKEIIVSHTQGNNASIKTSSGNDEIQIGTEDNPWFVHNNITVDAGDGNNFINAQGIRLSSNIDDELSKFSRNLNVKTGAGDDEINISDYRNVSIDAGDGNNHIIGNFESPLENVTVKSGNGDDVLEGQFIKADIDLGGGNNAVSDINAYNATLKSGAGNDTFNVIGTDLNIDAGDGNNEVNIDGNVENIAQNVTVKAGNGNDSIYASGINVNINSGAGNDIIHNRVEHGSISAGDGDDYIQGEFFNSTVNPGKGNDTVSVTNITGKGGWLYQYADGDGNDTVTFEDGSGAPGMIHLTSGAVSDVALDGNDVVVKVGSGSITLKDRVSISDPIAIKNASGTVEMWKKDGNSFSKVSDDSFIDNETFTNIANNTTINQPAVVNYGSKNIINLVDSDQLTGPKFKIPIKIGTTVINGEEVDLYMQADVQGQLLTNYGDDATINVGGYSNITLNGARQVIKSDQLSWNWNDLHVYGFGSDDTIYYPTKSIVNDAATGLFNVDDEGNLIINDKLTIHDASGKKINFTNGRNSVSMLIANDFYSGGGKDIDYVVNTGNRTVTANGSTVINKAENSFIRGLNDNDSVFNTRNASLTSINTGDGNDSVTNQAENVTINGGDGDDVISLQGSKQILNYFDDDGNDTVYGYRNTDTINIAFGTVESGYIDGLDTVLKLGDGSVRLKNTAGKGIITRQYVDGEEKIETKVYGNVITGTENADTLESNQTGVLIKPLSGDDVVSLKGSKQIIDYTEGNDTLYGYDADDTVRIGDWEFYGTNEKVGNDLILRKDDNQGSLTFKDVGNKKITMIGEDGQTLFVMPGSTTVDNKDIVNVVSRMDNATVKTGENVNYIDNSADNVSINAEGTVEFAYRKGSNLSFKSGAGDDNIHAEGDGEYYHILKNNITLDAGDGTNEIGIDGRTENGYSRNLNIKAGAGDDGISFDGYRNVTINAGDGNNYINGNEIENASVKSGNGDDQIGGNFLNSSIDLGDGNNFVDNIAGVNVTVKAGSGNDELYINGTDLNVDAGAGNNQINVSGSNEGIAYNATVNAGAGNDTLNVSGINVKLDAGAGNDTLDGRIEHGSISAGDGDDYIQGEFFNSTVNPGKGNDTVSVTNITGKGGWLYQYANGDGNDTVTLEDGSGAPGMIHLTSGAVSDVALDGNDVVVKVGSGSITLKDRLNISDPIAIKNASGSVEMWKKDGDSFSKVSDDSFIDNETFTDIANNTTINQPAVVNYGSKNIINLVDSDQLTGPTFEQFIQTGVIDGYPTGYTSDVAGQLLTNYGDDATINVGGYSNITLNGARQVINADGGTASVYGFGYDDTVYADNRDWLKSLMTVSDEDNNIELDGLTLNDARGMKLNFASKDSVTSVMFVNSDHYVGSRDVDYLINTYALNGEAVIANGSTVINKVENSFVRGLNDNDSVLNTSLASGASIGTGDGDDSITNQAENVIINGGAGDDVIFLQGSKQILNYLDDDGNDTVYGFSRGDTINIGYGSISGASLDGLDTVLKIGDSSIRLKNTAGKALTVKRYDKYEGETVTSQVYGNIIEGTEENDKLESTRDGVLIRPLSGDDVVSLKGSKQIVDYTGGNDTLYGYDEDDIIRVEDYWSFDTYTKNGNDIILVDTDEENKSLTLKNVGNKKLTMINTDGEELYIMSDYTISNDLGIPNVKNYADSVNVSLGSVVESFYNKGDNVTVNAADPIGFENANGNNVVFKSGAGNDSVGGIFIDDSNLRHDASNNVTLDVGDGDNDVNYNAGSYDYDNGSNFIGTNINIKAGAGNDNVMLSNADGFTIEAGAGDNKIELNNLSNGTIRAEAGNDTIHGENLNGLLIDVGDGDNVVEDLMGDNITLKTGAGNDNIDFLSNGYIRHSSINAGAGDDSISIKYDNNIDFKWTTVVGGAGNDTLYLYSNNALVFYQYANGDGNDTIHGYGEIIQLTSGSVSDAYLDDNYNVALKIGNGSIVVDEVYSIIAVRNATGDFSSWYINHDSTDLNERIRSLANTSYFNNSSAFLNGIANASIDADDQYKIDEENSAYAERIINAADNVTITDNSTDNVSFIENYGAGVIIDAEAKLDFLQNYGSNATINAKSTSVENYFGNNVVLNVDSDRVVNVGNEVEINLAEKAANIYSDGSDVTINAGAGNDNITLDGSQQVIYYAEGDGNDTVHGIGSDDTIRIDGSFTTVESNGDLILTVGNGSITFKDGAGVGFRAVDANFIPSADTTSAGIEYDPKKPSKLVVKDPFSGIVNAADFSDRITLIDANDSSREVILKAGAKATVIEAGTGVSTLIGGAKDDKLYGGTGINTFVYNAGTGKDAVYDYEAQDIISIVGATRDKLIFTDKKDSVIVTIDGDKRSQLTINKVKTTDALTIDIGGETFKYGELPEGVTFDDNNRKTGLNVGSTAADGVIVDAADIVSTAKILDASKAGGAVHLIGNGNKNVIQAGKNGSTLYGGNYNVADKLIGGDGADVFIYSTGDGNDVISDFDGSKDIVMLDGVTELKGDAFKWSGDKLTVKVGDQKLTFENPQGAIKFVDGANKELYTLGLNFPDGVGYNKKKTAVTVGADASNVGTIDLSNEAAYVSTVKDVNATAYGGSIEIIGNTNANVLYAGKGGAMLDGGEGADKLYGGDGADVFIFEGKGDDAIYGFDGSKDKIMLKGVTSLDPKNVSVNANKVVVTVDNQKLTIDDPQGRVQFVDSDGKELYAVGINFPDHVGYDKKKTAVTVGAEASDVGTIDLSNEAAYVPTVKDVNATAYGGSIEIIGNANPNVIRAGKGGSTLDGGEGADKLYGGDGADVFIFEGKGDDAIYGFDGSKDKIMLKGVTSLDPKNVSVNANKVVVTVDNQKLTIDDPQGRVQFVDSDGKELYAVGINFPDHVGYDKKKTAVTVGAKASDVGIIDLSSAAYLPTVKEVNASAYGGALNLVGNGNANVLRAGKGNATLNGGYNTTKNKATADKLYGTTVEGSSDVFVWDAFLGGADAVYNYSAAAGDIISVTADKALTIDKTDFKESGNKVVLSAGGGKLTVNDVKDQAVVVVNGDDTITFGSLPGGITYADNKKALKIADPYAGTVQADDYASTVVTLDGSAATSALTLVGNKKAKVFKGGAGQTTMTGSAAADDFHAGKGADVIVYAKDGGKDIVYDFDSSTDIIKLSGVTVSATDFVEKGNNIVLNVGKGSITLKDAPRGTITVEQDGGTVNYRTLPSNVTYKAAKEAVTLAKEFSGTLNAVDLQLPVKEINGSAATGSVHLTGMPMATKLTAGKGGSTLVGGAGNDTMVGGNGNDLFITSGGSDLIDKYTAGKDKIRIEGTLNAGKVNGSNVELTTSNGTVTIKGVLNKELTLTVDGTDQKYKFTRTDNTLDKALVGGNAQLPSTDYWFDADIQSDPLADILTVDNISVGIEDRLFDAPDDFKTIPTSNAMRASKHRFAVKCK